MPRDIPATFIIPSFFYYRFVRSDDFTWYTINQ